MKDLMKLVKECEQLLDEIGIAYAKDIQWSINTRAKKRWGQCRCRYGSYSININAELLDDSISDEATKNTIIHELLHSAPGGMTHKGEWHRYANMVNARHPELNIKRTTSSEEKGIVRDISPASHKYNFACKKCGAHIYRDRASRFTRNPQWYKCARCGGSIERL